METVEEKVIKIIQGKLPESRKNISLEDRIYDDIDIDSLDCVEICMEIEAEYEIKEFTIDGGLFNPSVQEIVNQIKNYKEKKPSGIEIIAEERRRQIEDGYCSEYENQQEVESMLPYYACCLALTEDYRIIKAENTRGHLEVPKISLHQTVKRRIQDLAKAGAIIAAEIDRINKLEEE